MNRKVELCRKSDFQLNQVLNNIDVLFVWFSFFSCIFSRISRDVSSFLLSSSTRIWSAFFMFSLWLSIFLYTNSVFLSRSNYPSQYFPSNWWNLIPDYKYFFLPMRFIWKQLLPHFFPLYEISVIDIIDRIWKWKGRKAVHFNFNTAYHSISVRLRQMH